MIGDFSSRQANPGFEAPSNPGWLNLLRKLLDGEHVEIPTSGLATGEFSLELHEQAEVLVAGVRSEDTDELWVADGRWQADLRTLLSTGVTVTGGVTTTGTMTVTAQA
jgi:hypothetical protein